ncbi:MAG: hypothetical protein ACI8UP_005582 [Porticoccaceae bacterium]|jgi:hypothetical protein
MSSVNLEALTSEFPALTGVVKRLVTFLESTACTATQDKFYSYDRISVIAETQPNQELATVLSRLVQGGLLEQVIRVENNSAGIGDFNSISEIPELIHDWRTDSDIAVTPDKLHLYYKLHART